MSASASSAAISGAGDHNRGDGFKWGRREPPAMMEVCAAAASRRLCPPAFPRDTNDSARTEQSLGRSTIHSKLLDHRPYRSWENDVVRPAAAADGRRRAA